MVLPSNLPAWYLKDKQGATEFSSMQNALIPYLGADAQMMAAANLQSGDAANFGEYDPSSIKPPTTLMPEGRKAYLSRQRAERALSAIERMKSLSGITADSPGLAYLKQSISLLRNQGAPGGAMSRSKYMQFANSLKNLQKSQAAMDAEEYGTLSDMFTTTDTGAGNLMPYRYSGTRALFGTANRKLYS